MTEHRDNLRGIVAMLAASLLLVLNDSLVKAVGDRLPLGQIMTVRGVAATLAILLFAWRAGLLGGFRGHVSGKVWVRSLGEVGGTLLFLTALVHMPIANITTIVQASPLLITAAGAVFLAEKVGWRRWTAVVVGFLGILIIVRPGPDGFNAYALLAVGTMLLVVLRDIVTRLIGIGTPTVVITLVTSGAVTATGMLLVLVQGWKPMSIVDVLQLSSAGILLVLGYVAGIIAVRHGEVATVAPFRYSAIVFAILAGWAAWGEVPDPVTFIGIAVVVATGVYTVHRERRIARMAVPAPVSAPAGPEAGQGRPLAVGDDR